MKIYIDTEFKCHPTNEHNNYREVETDFFNGKCNEFIEGHYFVPIGESCTSPDGTVINGGYIAPCKPCSELDDAQREYERERLKDAEMALAILLGGEAV